MWYQVIFFKLYKIITHDRSYDFVAYAVIDEYFGRISTFY